MPKQGKSAKIVLVGQTLEVVKSSNQTLVGLHGEVIDETKSTIRIQTERGIKAIPKDKVAIKVKGKTIDGRKLLGRIEERIKS